jgi:hypothetical protein
VLGNPIEVLLRALYGLLNRDRDLVGLAVADTDHFALVADDHQRGEREPSAALDYLGHPIDLDDPLLELEP